MNFDWNQTFTGYPLQSPSGGFPKTTSSLTTRPPSTQPRNDSLPNIGQDFPNAPVAGDSSPVVHLICEGFCQETFTNHLTIEFGAAHIGTLGCLSPKERGPPQQTQKNYSPYFASTIKRVPCPHDEDYVQSSCWSPCRIFGKTGQRSPPVDRIMCAGKRPFLWSTKAASGRDSLFPLVSLVPSARALCPC